jgi:hypothetical protein
MLAGFATVALISRLQHTQPDQPRIVEPAESSRPNCHRACYVIHHPFSATCYLTKPSDADQLPVAGYLEDTSLLAVLHSALGKGSSNLSVLPPPSAPRRPSPDFLLSSTKQKRTA